MNRKIKLIVNPAAGSQTVSKKWPNLKQTLHNIIGEVAADFTTQMGDATQLARRAIFDGYETIVAVGGDGTINEVINGFFENGRLLNPAACLGIFSMGTGDDLVRSLATPKKLEDAAGRIHDQRVKKCDLGRLSCVGRDDRPMSRYFVNIADAGFGAKVAEMVSQSTKALGVSFAYLAGVLRTMAVYKNQSIQIQVDETSAREGPVSSVVVANGQYFGGGMWVAPQARIDDGLFDVVIIGDLRRREIVANIHKIYNGKLVDHPKVTCLRGKQIKLNSSSEVRIEADGEQAGKLPATFEILPSVINIIC
jgi:YegS/Rv2252/BmrU family lipid kinase